jgi:hypothetical protein
LLACQKTTKPTLTIVAKLRVKLLMSLPVGRLIITIVKFVGPFGNLCEKAAVVPCCGIVHGIWAHNAKSVRSSHQLADFSKLPKKIKLFL